MTKHYNSYCYGRQWIAAGLESIERTIVLPHVQLLKYFLIWNTRISVEVHAFKVVNVEGRGRHISRQETSRTKTKEKGTEIERSRVRRKASPGEGNHSTDPQEPKDQDSNYSDSGGTPPMETTKFLEQCIPPSSPNDPPIKVESDGEPYSYEKLVESAKEAMQITKNQRRGEARIGN
jgi:hypothetical protein